MRVFILTVLSTLALVHCEDYSCPKGKSKNKKIVLSPGDSFTYNTNFDTQYYAKTKCPVAYKASKKCKKGIRFSCDSFDLPNRDSARCRKGDRLILGKKAYCGSTVPAPITLKGKAAKKGLRVLFASDKKNVGAGAQCTAMCLDGATTTTTAAPTTTSGGGAGSGCTCGLANRVSKIVGGVNTEVNEYPWQAGLVSKGSSTVWCGGSLLNSKWVLTAAHCTAGEKTNRLQVLLGEHKYNTNTETTHIRASIDQIVDHPDYNDRTTDNDYSMLRLKNAVNFASYPHIRPICLPTDTSETYAGVTATVTGWGTTSSQGSLSSTLKEVNVGVVSNGACKNDYGYHSSWITSNMLCAVVAGGGKDSCQGDSGGPLVTANGGSGVTPGQNYVQIGVVSWGSGCADANYPGVYARVTKKLQWIQDNLNSAGASCPAS